MGVYGAFLTGRYDIQYECNLIYRVISIESRDYGIHHKCSDIGDDIFVGTEISR